MGDNQPFKITSVDPTIYPLDLEPAGIWGPKNAGLPSARDSGEFPSVKFVALLILLAGPLAAEILAHFHTSLGDVEVELQYPHAPQAVANFITLAEGSRPWVDPFNGKIRSEPFYNGIRIHRTANSGSFKFAQGGSPKGDGSDGPGYTFKDEFLSPLVHVPYVLSMANAGPNTNGSQFFFTGSLSQPTFNNVHTIFGLVTAPASRAVVDAMIAAGPNGTTIHEVTITRTDPAAVAFDEHAQNLPVVTCPGGSLTVNPGAAAVWHFSAPLTTGAVFHAYRSTTMAAGSWSELVSAEQHVGLSAASPFAAVAAAVLDDAAAPKAFYHLYVAHHPGSVAPSTLANRTVTIPLGANSLKYVFDSSGVAGTTTYTPATGTAIVGPFTTVNPNNGLPLSPTASAHAIRFVADTPALNPRYLWVKLGCDSADATEVTCHHSSQTYNGLWQPFAAGKATISP